MSGAAPGPVQVAVVGGPVAAVSAALAVHRALPDATVSLVVLPADRRVAVETIGTAGLAMARFHDAIGLDHIRLVRHIAGIADKGTRFTNWPGSAQRFSVRRGQAMAFVEGIARHQLWLRLAGEGQADLPPWDEIEPKGAPAPTGLRFEPARYARALGDLLPGANIIVGTARRALPVRGEGGRIVAVETDAGHSVTADLYLDCTGPDALLATAAGAGFVPWPELPPLALTGIGPSRIVPSPYQHVGPIPDAVVVDTGLSAFRFAPGPQEAIGGALADPWPANVIALGEAATRVPPIGSLHFDIFHHDLLRLVELLPSGTGPALTGEYRRRTRLVQGYWRDWSAAHWLAGNGTVPPGLAQVLAQWDARGRLPVRDGDPVDKGEWIDLLIGLGRRPARIDPTAMVPSAQEALDLLLGGGKAA